MAIVYTRAISSLSFALLLATAAPAAAAPPAAPAEPDDPYEDAPAAKPAESQWKIEQRRETLYREGRALAKQGHWQEALDKLREVNQIRSHPRVLLWMGFPEEQLGNLLKAKAIYTQAREDARVAKLKREEQDAEQALQALEPKIPRIVLHIPASSVASVYLDSARVPFQQDGWEVNPGKHSVSVTWAERRPFHTEVEAKVGEVNTTDVPFPEALPPSPPPPASGPPGGPIALGVLGGVALVAGAIVVGHGAKTRNDSEIGGGAGVLLGGAGLGIGALIWGLQSPSSAAPADEQKSVTGKAMRPRRTMRAPIDVQISPSPFGFSAGVAGRF